MLAFGLAMAIATPAAAQEPLSDTVAAEMAGEAAAVQTAQTAQSQQPVGSGLPRRAVPPPTMAAQWPIFALFAATWVAIVGYLLLSGRKVSRLAGRLAEREDGR